LGPRHHQTLLAAADAAGMAYQNRLGRPLPAGGWSSSEVEAELTYVEHSGPALRVKQTTAHHDHDQGVLERFVALAGGSAAMVLRFARRYGALDLCVHGLPPGHRLLMAPAALPTDPRERERLFNWRCSDLADVQPVAVYHRYAEA
jgi:hypothetical protein